MRLATYRGPDGNPRAGAVIGDAGDERIVDLVEATGGSVPAGDLLALLRSGSGGTRRGPHRSRRGQRRPAARLASSSSPRSGARASCWPSPATSRRTSRRAAASASTRPRSCPKLFIKPSSAIIGPGEAVALPTRLERARLGARARDRHRDARPRHPARQGPRPHRRATRSSTTSPRARCSGASQGREPCGFDDFFDWLNGKWGDGFAALGPWITTTDSVTPDPNELEMTLKVNDKVWQHGSTADMIFSPEEIIAFASRFMTLEPGDVIAGGTLDGTGDAAGVYLKAGDVMDGTIGELGTLVTPVVAAIGGLTDGRARPRSASSDPGSWARPGPGSSPVTSRRRRLVAVAAAAAPRTWPRQHGVEALDEDALFGRDDIDAVVDRHAGPHPSAARRGRGARRQARARREADDQHPGRRRRDGRRRRCRRRPTRRGLAAPVPRRRRWPPRPPSRRGGSATSG